MLGFSVTVVDEREEFCNPSRFPKAATLCLPFEKALPQLSCDNSTYYVIVTRGHQHDYTCLSYLLAQQPCAYLGMIGSRRKVALVHQSLLEDGFTQQQIDRVFSPIGLPIHAQTPEEISVSILAQIIEVKNTRLPDSSLEDPVFDAIDKADGPVAFCMIVRKSGSIPRGAGSKMAVDQNGMICGTIGGGKIEYDVIQTAQNLCLNRDHTPVFQTFLMDNQSAKEDGMICGGSADVFICLVD